MNRLLENEVYIKKIAICLLLIVIALISATKVSKWASSTSTHEYEIAQIDKKIETVLELTGGATAASAVISLMPDDQCTPIAEQLAELAKYFLVVLSALYLEKYLISIIGVVSFSVLIPIALAIIGFGVWAKRSNSRNIALKLIICALVLYWIIPVSVKVSDKIYDNYETSIQDTIEVSEALSEAEDNSDEGLLNQLSDWITKAAKSAVDYVTDILSRFVESLAVMIVTSCLIPILVLVFSAWLIKLLFGAQIGIQEK